MGLLTCSSNRRRFIRLSFLTRLAESSGDALPSGPENRVDVGDGGDGGLKLPTEHLGVGGIMRNSESSGTEVSMDVRTSDTLRGVVGGDCMLMGETFMLP